LVGIGIFATNLDAARPVLMAAHAEQRAHAITVCNPVTNSEQRINGEQLFHPNANDPEA